jgi:NAD(P)-dependent dehydrogenase (short-subunit alcohol dehydrogenase family)
MLAAQPGAGRPVAVNKVLVLGGYGGFGARLSRRLAQDGWHVLVAGRNGSKAADFAATLPDATGIYADRDGDLAGLLDAHLPTLLIDAAGPFQGSSYRVAQACIAAGVDYLDLADARDFVCGIGRLDATAKAAGVRIISGASSVPTLSGAVLRDLCAGMDSVTLVEMAISASNRATAGPSVAAAILSAAGKPLKLWRGQRWQTTFGWQESRHVTFAVNGVERIHRRVALTDIPDHEIVPAVLPGNPATRFLAGPEFAFQTRAVSALGWLVRLGWFRSLIPLARWLLPLQRLTGWAGSDRSAMLVEAKGVVGSALQIRKWTLIADKGDGPEIPVLAAQLIARMLAKGKIEPGARDASALLLLADFQPLFDALAIQHEKQVADYAPLYRRVMGADYDTLPHAVRELHKLIGDKGASGNATVVRGSNPLARLIANLFRFPEAGEHPLHVDFREEAGVERWTRDFSGRKFFSELSQDGNRVIERFGPMRFHFDLISQSDGLVMAMRKWSVFKLRMPLALAPRSPAREWGEGDHFHFDVPISLPIVGLVVHYRGWLQPD